MELKRWNPDNMKERPGCPYQPSKGKCLQNCVHLIVDKSMHGCSLQDKATATIQIAHAMSGAAQRVQEEPKRGPGRPPKE